MSDSTVGGSVLEAPPESIIFKRRLHPRLILRDLWNARELVVTLAERDLRARYKQTFFGFAWAVITPLTLMVVFTLFIKRVANIDTHGVPYALFSYLGLLPWGYFSSSVSSGGTSLVNNTSLLNKVYCPREVFPLGTMAVAGVDTLVSVSMLIVLFFVFTFAPAATVYWVPFLVLVLLVFTCGVVLALSSLTVYVRDLRQALPILLQLGLFATPVAYGLDGIPAWARPTYVIINPLAVVIEGLRRCVLYNRAPPLHLLELATMSSVVYLAIGVYVFKKLEGGIADVA